MTESSSIVIIEAGGHGAVLDVALSSGRKVLAFIYEAIVGQDMLGVPIVGKANDISLASDYAFFVATGDNRSMQIVFEKTRQRMLGHDGVMLIHQTAYALPSASLAPYSILIGNAFVGPNCPIGMWCILNTGSQIHHDVIMRPYPSLDQKLVLAEL